MTNDMNTENEVSREQAQHIPEDGLEVRVTMRPAGQRGQTTRKTTTATRTAKTRGKKSTQTAAPAPEPEVPEHVVVEQPAAVAPETPPTESETVAKPRRGRSQTSRSKAKAEEQAMAVEGIEPAPVETPPPTIAEAPLTTVEEQKAESEDLTTKSSKTRRGRGRTSRSKANVVTEKPGEDISAVAVTEPVPVEEPELSSELSISVESAPAPAKPEKAPRKRAGRKSKAAVEKAAVEPFAKTPTKEIIVNVEPRETRIAVIEGQTLMELHIEREERVVGSIYKGRVANVLPGMDAAFVDIGLERNAFLYVGDILPEAADIIPSQRRRDLRNMKIKDMIKLNQEILVQVVKAPRGTKGARVSTRISLPGRYIVLMPDSDNLGISRKVDDSGERDRLKKIGEKIRPKNFGLIIRTEAEGMSEQDLRQDVELIMNLWSQIQSKSLTTPAPGLVHQDLSIIFKTIRDVFSEDIAKLIIDSPSDYEKASELVRYISPKLESRLVLYEDPEPVFERYAIESEIERLLRPKVWLKSGGYLTIDQTEALTTIDVNTGKFIGSTSLSETILRTNLDAVAEVARQLRLRDIGGIIIIDFIDMSSQKDRNQVMSALEKALRTDRTRTKIAHLSPLGLVEMTRKRTAESVTEVLTESCPYCQGRGRVSSTNSVAIQIERELRKQCVQTDEEAFLVWANPDVAAELIGAGGEQVERLERELHRALYVRSDESLHVEKFKILPGDLQELNRQILPYRGGQVVETSIDDSQLFSPPRAAGWCDGFLIDVVNGGEYIGERVKVKLTQVYRSYAFGEVVKPAKVLDKSEPI